MAHHYKAGLHKSAKRRARTGPNTTLGEADALFRSKTKEKPLKAELLVGQQF